MKRTAIVAALVVTFGFGVALGVAWAKKSIDESLYVGQPPQQAASALLELAENQAGRGSWERIRVARVHYLAGDVDTGQAIFDSIINSKVEPSDWIRMGRVYYQAGDWEAARDAFERVVELEPDDEDWLAEIGAYFNLQGERERAEELFRLSFKEDAGNHHNTATVAGSYVGVAPQY